MLRSNHSYDAMGRLTRQIDWDDQGYAAYDRTVTYTDRGQIETDTSITRQKWGTTTGTVTAATTNTYGTGTGYALGAVVSSATVNTRSDNAAMADTSTANSYVWYDGAALSQASFDSDTGSSSNPVFYTNYSYNGSGHLKSAQINDGRRRTVNYTNDLSGQALRRSEADLNGTSGNPHEIWYRFGGREMGYTGNNRTLDSDYKTSIANRMKTPGTGAFRFGETTGSAHADFDPGVQAITSYNQGGAGGSHTVRGGETLGSIAAQLWGDSSLWYRLAEANGITGAMSLTEGQRLTVPSGVMKSAHNANTFKPYDPAETIGDTNPTNPSPPKAAAGNKCGAMGAIMLSVVAIAVTALTAGAAIAAFAPASAGITGVGSALTALAAGKTGLAAGTLIGIGAASGMAGSIASQGVGVATNLQDKFSWKSVAMAGIAGGVGAGIGPGGNFLGRLANGAASSIITQGIGRLTGLQKKFDWAGVAAAGLGAAVGGAASRELGLHGVGGIGGKLLANTAGGIANAAARSLVNGDSFGDNLMAALPDIIGQTVGGALVDEVTASARLTAGAKATAAELNPDILEDPERFAQFRQDYKDTQQNIRNLDFGDNPYKNAEMLAGTYKKLLSHAADQGAAAEALSVLQGSDAVVSAYDLEGTEWAARGDHITVRGTRYRPSGPALGLKLLDTLSIQAGSLGVKLGNAYKELPTWAQHTITFFGIVADAAGGPLVAGLRQVGGHLMNKASEAAATSISSRFIKAGYNPVDAALGAGGALLIGSLVFTGVTGAKKLLASGAIGRSVERVKDMVHQLRTGQSRLANELGVLSEAARRKGDFGLGSATAKDAMRLGKAWVGEGYTVASNGKILLSADGLRQFRPPSAKPRLGIEQANFESRFRPDGKWQGNGHLDIKTK